MNRFGDQDTRVVDAPRPSWAARAEAAIRSLRDVAGASVQMAGDEIREVHVLTRSNRPPKQIVRDVQTVLLTRFDRNIDYRVVSVAYVGAEAPEPATVEVTHPEPAAAPPASAPNPAPAPAPSVVPSVAPSPAPTATRGAWPMPTERIRFQSVNLFVSGPRTQAQVELKWKGLPRMGSASGWSTRAGSDRLIAGATLAAVQEFVADDVALSIHEVEFLRLGRRRAVVVSISLLAHRQEKILVGSCAVEHDVPESIVLATLSALNRVVGGLRTRELTEYVLRPTST
jgi:hypothetical protein